MKSWNEKLGTYTPFAAVAKQLFGKKYERVSRSLALCIILFTAVSAAELRVQVSSAVLFLTSSAFSAGIMWRVLNSSQNAEIFQGLFMLPFDDREMTVSYVLAFSSYTLLTKTSAVLALFFAAGHWNAAEIGAAVLLACLGCGVSAGLYGAVHMRQEGRSAYVFYRPAASHGKKRYTGRKGSILRYLLRYLTSNKNYLVNTAGLWLIACLLPLMLGQFDGLDTLPVGFAVLCMNTPVCVLLSCDPALEQAVRVLPGQSLRFCGAYGLFICLVNFAGSSLYLVSWQAVHGGIGPEEILTAAAFAAAGAVLSVFLEWRYPIRGWKIENDLWHHPRKYIVPAVLLLAGVFVGMQR